MSITSFLRSHRLTTEILVGALAVGSGVGIGIGVAGSPLAASAAPSSPTSATVAVANTAKHPLLRHLARGTIATENGDTWTITNPAGKTITVTVTGTTQFGTKAHPEQESQFAVGSKVLVVGKRTSATDITARAMLTRPSSSTSPISTPAASTSAA
ncbi:MAG: hypothetical protein ACRDYC_10800 [Acidimicrobiales bacterium]